MKSVILTAVCLLALAACDKPASNDPKPEDKNAPTTTNATTTSTAAVTTTTPAPAPVTIAEGDLSTPADFEESAEKAITTKNYKAELTTLEADIAKE